MARRRKRFEWRAALAGLIALVVAIGALEFFAPGPAYGQFFRDDRGGFFSRPAPQPRRGGLFDGLFGPRQGGGVILEDERPADYSRAPPPKKTDATPSVSVVVMGDSLADWLSYGLEDALADSPEIAVMRKIKTGSGLIRYENRSDLDWWHVARDNLAKDKADFVVMMLGLNDRQAIRETQSERDKRTGRKDQKPEQKPGEQKTDQAKPGEPAATTEAAKKPDDDEGEQPNILAPERGPRGSTEFRTERWEEIYVKRIDETIAALKSKNVPVLWVGLPPIRGTRSTAEAVYLNDLFRARAEKAGIVYVDVWEGFVDEQGRFTTHGPDFEGQTRRLRAGDGVHFTRYGARKLAHYVERELRRFMANRSMPVALPSQPLGAPTEAAPTGPAVRPVAGPVLPLTAGPAGGEELLGGAATRPVHGDAVATRVLVKGEPVAAPSGRADDYSWPRPSDPNAIEPLSPTAAAARAQPAAPAKAQPAKKDEPARAKRDEPKKQQPQQVRPPQQRAQAPQQPQQRAPSPFGWLR